MALYAFLWFATQPDIKRTTYDLKGGSQIIMDSSMDTGSWSFTGEAAEDFVLSLQHPNGVVEEVAKGSSDGGPNDTTIPHEPFEMRSNGQSLILRCNALFYERPLTGGGWDYRGDLMGNQEMLSIARLLMPDAYRKTDEYRDNTVIPHYKLERWDESKGIVVLLKQSEKSVFDEWDRPSKPKSYERSLWQKWPRRLVFRGFQFDQHSTVALNK